MNYGIQQCLCRQIPDFQTGAFLTDGNGGTDAEDQCEAQVKAAFIAALGLNLFILIHCKIVINSLWSRRSRGTPSKPNGPRSC